MKFCRVQRLFLGENGAIDSESVAVGLPMLTKYVGWKVIDMNAQEAMTILRIVSRRPI